MNPFLYGARLSFVGILVRLASVPAVWICVCVCVCVSRRIHGHKMIASNLVSFFSSAVKMPPSIRTSVASYRQIRFWYRQISQRQLRYLRNLSGFWLESKWLPVAIQVSDGTVLYCTVLYCTVLYCTVLYYLFGVNKQRSVTSDWRNEWLNK